MPRVSLTRGKFTRVDAKDLLRVSRYRWCYQPGLHTGYAIRAGGIRMHHFLFGQPTKGLDVDHINGDGLDNRKRNIRFVPRSLNRANDVHRRSGKRTSKYPGVSWDKLRSKWRAQSNGRCIGNFASEKAARKAYQEVQPCL